MINANEMWDKLSKYLKVDKALEQGFSTGKYTKILASYAKEVVAIDLSEYFFDIAAENLKDYDNVEIKLMDAKKMPFSDKSFDVLLNTSFHEFDLSGDVYSVDLDLKREILKEMIRVSDTIVFVEPTSEAVTNELFKVFNPVENHKDRIIQSNNLIDKVMEEEGYDLIETGFSYNEHPFETIKDLEESVITWWDDIKVPKDEEEKKQMISQIDDILEKAGMLDTLNVIEKVQYRVYRNS